MAFPNTLKQDFPIAWGEFIKNFIFSYVADRENNFLNLNVEDTYSVAFEKLPFDFQLGVLLSFLEKYSIYPFVYPAEGYWGFGVYYLNQKGKWGTFGGINFNTGLKTRAEAYQKAIIKAFKLLEF